MFFLIVAAAEAAVCTVDPAGAWPTLQAAVDDVGCDPILVDADLTENVVVSRDVSIASTTGAVLRPASAGPILTISAGDVDLEGLVFADGVAVDGAGVYATTTGALALVDVTFENNAASGDGGGLYTTADTLLDGVDLTGNTAGGAGGGVYAAGAQLWWRNGAAIGNSATSGGGLMFSGVDDIRFLDTTLEDNVAVEGGGWYQDGGALTTTGVYATNNTATNGGAVWMGGTGANWDIAQCSIYDNHASGTGGGIDLTEGTVDAWNFNLAKNGAASGGGVAVGPDALAVLHFSTVVDNTTTVAGTGTQVAVQGGVLFDRSIAAYLQVRPAGSPDCVATGSGYVEGMGSLGRGETSCVFSIGQPGLVENAGGRYYMPSGPGPVVDMAETLLCPATDLLGTARAQGAACDKGAIELP